MSDIFMMKAQSQNDAMTKFETVCFMKCFEWCCGHWFYYLKFQEDCLEGAHFDQNESVVVLEK